MEYIVGNSEMKAIDHTTIHSIGIPAMVLMEQAAMAVSNKLLKKLSINDSILAICGLGNNGADGVAVARMLAHRGYNAKVLLLGDVENGTDELKQQIEIAHNLGVNILNKAEISEYTIIIDGIFGIGLSRPVSGVYETIIYEVNEANNIVYSVDIPSGIHGENGKIMGSAIKADYTITFGLLKKGLVLYPGCMYAGEIMKADIGFPSTVIEEIAPKTFIYGTEDLKRLPKRLPHSNKGTYGRVLIIAGSKNMSGACYLSAKAAYRSGAGLVKILTVEENRIILQTLLPEAIIATYSADNISQEEETMKEHIAWATSIVIGPGIGISRASEFLLNIVLIHAHCPVVVDADGLHALAKNKDYVKRTEEGCMIRLPKNIILTPHVKEMACLLGCDTSTVKEDLVEMAVSATKDQDFTLALKDARTIVTTKDQVYINCSGNNGMSTGGSGDVLTGIIAAFTAQGLSNYEAACLGVYVHGLAGDCAMDKKGVYSLMAGDIVDHLEQVFVSVDK